MKCLESPSRLGGNHEMKSFCKPFLKTDLPAPTPCRPRPDRDPDPTLARPTMTRPRPGPATSPTRPRPRPDDEGDDDGDRSASLFNHLVNPMSFNPMSSIHWHCHSMSHMSSIQLQQLQALQTICLMSNMAYTCTKKHQARTAQHAALALVVQ